MNQDGNNLVDFGTGNDSTAMDASDDGFVVDFSQVSDQQFPVLPRGIYDAEIDDLTFGMSQSSGNPMWTVKFETTHEGKKSKLFSHVVFTPAAMPRSKKFLAAVAPEVLAGGAFSPKAVAEGGALLGRKCRIRVDIKPYEGQLRNNVRDVLPPAEGAGSSDSFLG